MYDGYKNYIYLLSRKDILQSDGQNKLSSPSSKSYSLSCVSKSYSLIIISLIMCVQVLQSDYHQSDHVCPSLTV